MGKLDDRAAYREWLEYLRALRSDKASDTLFVSDLKLCGLYEYAYPNPAAPSKVTVMGLELDVLPGAQADDVRIRLNVGSGDHSLALELNVGNLGIVALTVVLDG